MKAVQYKGSVYVEAGGGDYSPGRRWKCHAGTHWNAVHKRCMKLPPELLAKSNRAFKSSTIANNMSAKPSPDHMKAKNQHMLARSHHQEAWSAADNAGFKDLGKKHRTLVGTHSDKASRHESKLFPNQQV